MIIAEMLPNDSGQELERFKSFVTCQQRVTRSEFSNGDGPDLFRLGPRGD
jgi:hypothetical protein